MAPQEKAEQLIEKFIVHTKVFHQEIGWEEYRDSAKQCALIAVDELINATQYEAHIQMAFNPCETTEYWLEVKAFLQP